MDKLSMWQLMAKLERVSTTSDSMSNEKDERDWIQIFLEEVVEPQFKSKLPTACALLRSKIFPDSPLSRSPSSSSSRATSPDIPKHTKSSTRQPSPAPSAVSSTTGSKARTLERTRSRSLSLSLAQERERERERSVGLGATKKRVLNREVSMSRVFKPKPKLPEVKVTSKRKRPDNDTPAPKVKDVGVTLVVDTPVKPRTGINTKSVLQTTNGVRRTVGMTGSHSLPSFGHVGQDGDDDDDEWDLQSSPNILLLGGKGDTGGLGLSDGEDDQWGVSDTPSKSKRPRVR